MASEITYAELSFNNAPPPAEVTAHQEESKPQGAAQKHTPCLPWLIAALFLVLAVSLLIALVVIHFGLGTNQRCEDCKVLRECLKEKSCVEEEPEGKGRVWTCCPMGWEPFQASCYYFSKDTMSWRDSERNCTGMGSHLVVINTGTEQDFIFTHINGIVTGNQETNYCIGLIERETSGQWRWVDFTPYNESIAFWISGNPSHQSNNKCAVMGVLGKQTNRGNKNWKNVLCSKPFNRICETAALRF